MEMTKVSLQEKLHHNYINVTALDVFQQLII